MQKQLVPQNFELFFDGGIQYFQYVVDNSIFILSSKNKCCATSDAFRYPSMSIFYDMHPL